MKQHTITDPSQYDREGRARAFDEICAKAGADLGPKQRFDFQMANPRLAVWRHEGGVLASHTVFRRGGARALQLNVVEPAPLGTTPAPVGATPAPARFVARQRRREPPTMPATPVQCVCVTQQVLTPASPSMLAPEQATLRLAVGGRLHKCPQASYGEADRVARDMAALMETITQLSVKSKPPAATESAMPAAPAKRTTKATKQRLPPVMVMVMDPSKGLQPSGMKLGRKGTVVDAVGLDGPKELVDAQRRRIFERAHASKKPGTVKGYWGKFCAITDAAILNGQKNITIFWFLGFLDHRYTEDKVAGSTIEGYRAAVVFFEKLGLFVPNPGECFKENELLKAFVNSCAKDYKLNRRVPRGAIDEGMLKELVDFAIAREEYAHLVPAFRVQWGMALRVGEMLSMTSDCWAQSPGVDTGFATIISPKTAHKRGGVAAMRKPMTPFAVLAVRAAAKGLARGELMFADVDRALMNLCIQECASVTPGWPRTLWFSTHSLRHGGSLQQAMALMHRNIVGATDQDMNTIEWYWNGNDVREDMGPQQQRNAAMLDEAASESDDDEKHLEQLPEAVRVKALKRRTFLDAEVPAGTCVAQTPAAAKATTTARVKYPCRGRPTKAMVEARLRAEAERDATAEPAAKRARTGNL